MKTKNVLLVEDDLDLSDAFKIILTEEGYKVTIALNGQEALDKLKTTSPDIILLDLLMPIMDGKEFLKNFNNEDGVPIIVFSNLDSRIVVDEVLELGATRYMLKAWSTPKELVKIIEQTIKS